MAVDIKTLRIGSHVEYNGKRVRVALVRDDGCICEYKDNEQDVIVGLGVEKKPIPITPELLKELGFEYRDNTYWERWFLGSFDIERKEGSSYFDYNSEIRLEFLHELEDLYYLIYGVELIEE